MKTSVTEKEKNNEIREQKPVCKRTGLTTVGLTEIKLVQYILDLALKKKKSYGDIVISSKGSMIFLSFILLFITLGKTE